LEAIGALLPFFSMAKLLAGRHVTIHVDNMAVVFGAEKGSSKSDQCASIFIRILLLACSFLGISLHTEHVPRKSNLFATLADSLTRESSMHLALEVLKKKDRVNVESPALAEWIRNPGDDWDLPKRMPMELEQIF